MDECPLWTVRPHHRTSHALAPKSFTRAGCRPAALAGPRLTWAPAVRGQAEAEAQGREAWRTSRPTSRLRSRKGSEPPWQQSALDDL